MNIISLLQRLLGTTRPFPVMHSGWQKMKEEHKAVWVSCLNCLQRDLLLYMDCRMEKRFGFFLPLQQFTPTNFAVLDISYDIKPHTVRGHVVSHSSWKLQLVLPAKKTTPHNICGSETLQNSKGDPGKTPCDVDVQISSRGSWLSALSHKSDSVTCALGKGTVI